MIAASAAEHFELVVFGLLVAVAALAVVARLVRVPYPILLVIGGLAIGFIPGFPDIELDPDLVLLVFLPPLLYAAAFFSNLREPRDRHRPHDLVGDADELRGLDRAAQVERATEQRARRSGVLALLVPGAAR